MDFYDASKPAAADEEDPLARLQALGGEQRMLAFLDEMAESIERSRDRTRAEGLDPEIADLLDAICSSEQAPMEFRALHRRVERGQLTWLQFWLAPALEEGGPQLINAAMKAQTQSLNELLAQFEDQEPDAPRAGVLGR